MRRSLLSFCLLFPLVASGLAPADDVGSLLDRLRSARNPAEQRAAWDKLVRSGPKALPQILEAIDTPDTAVANWVVTAFDAIAEPAIKKDSKAIEVAALLAFGKDAKRQGRARRVALDTVERLQPGARNQLLRDWINDPEFGFDAIDLRLAELASAKTLPKEEAAAGYEQLLAATNDVSQARIIANRLKELGKTVSLADTFGFPREWYLIGPFEGGGIKSFKTVYPPEQKVDLQAEYPGKEGKPVRWKRVSIPEAVGGTYPVMIDLRKPLAEAEDAVGYAYTVIDMPAEREVEFRAAADDNITVWVNGEKAFAFEEWKNGMRLDRHRFKVRLKAGPNTVLVKVCQGKGDPGNPDGNWEFVLRICDAAGRGVPFKNGLPAVK